MTKILDRLPIPNQDDLAFIGEEQARLRAHEIIVWVSLRAETALEWDLRTPRFPAILDTGHSHNFSLRACQLTRWAGLRPELLPCLGHVRQAGQRFPIHAATVWVHRNMPGQRDLRRDAAPQRLHLRRGIAVHPDEGKYPRLPLLGLRALLDNRLHLSLDGQRREVGLRTPDWRTWLRRWLG